MADRYKVITFNSLSRDHTRSRKARLSLRTTMLSTPSLGITEIGNRDGVPKERCDFQLPLSGSPSPIPGFFGSPLLSAAAALRTNDF